LERAVSNIGGCHLDSASGRELGARVCFHMTTAAAVGRVEEKVSDRTRARQRLRVRGAQL